MPGKSRHGRGKRSFQSKRGKSKRHPSATVVQQQVAAQTDKPVTPPKSAPSARVPTPMARLTAARYPYVVAELRRIGILAGIMLGILIVLALVLS